MKNKSLIFSTGLAMFSMFFGSGNLVFPLVVGQMSEGHFAWASFGILLTGVLVPFLGILAMLLFNGSSHDFFSRIGPKASFWFSLIALSLMGPFGVLARCITVAHGAFRLICPDISLWVFSAFFVALLFFLTIRKSRIVPLLGSILTPILLLCLALIAFFGLKDMPIQVAQDGGAWESFKNGIFQGYQTMDLLAAFFFSSFVIKHLQNHKKTPSDPAASIPIFFKSSLVGAALLSAIYFVLVLLGSAYSSEIGAIPPQEVLGFIAQKSLGAMAAPIVSMAVIFACLTTAIVLALLFADFLKKEIAKDKIKTAPALLITLAIAFCISTLEFSGIAKILGPILEITYPALIVLTLLSIFHKLWGWSSVRIPILAAFVLKLISQTI